MKRQFGAAAGVLSMVAATAIVLAGPAVAAPPWVMPDVRGMNLQQANDTVKAVTDEKDLVVHSINLTGPPQQQTNLTNWIVCSQSPRAGGNIGAKTSIVVGVRRPNSSCS
ncbi:hypothetical protein ACQI4L_04765 [Mycolicibacterium litorale]|uniref:hypothetical protein n=1 Tax=Mycolicibacterium litorale TaxID=758802 RepID=UPI003CFB4E53